MLLKKEVIRKTFLCILVLIFLTILAIIWFPKNTLTANGKDNKFIQITKNDRVLLSNDDFNLVFFDDYNNFHDELQSNIMIKVNNAEEFNEILNIYGNTKIENENIPSYVTLLRKDGNLLLYSIYDNRDFSLEELVDKAYDVYRNKIPEYEVAQMLAEKELAAEAGIWTDFYIWRQF